MWLLNTPAGADCKINAVLMRVGGIVRPIAYMRNGKPHFHDHENDL